MSGADLANLILDFKGFDPDIEIELKTSGSMGIPKSVVHTLQQHVLAAQAVVDNTVLNQNSCSLLSLPLHHVGGLSVLVRAWVSGGRWVLPPKAWTPVWAVEEMGVTHMSLVSTQLKRFMQNPESVRALRKLRAILLGGSAMPESLIKQAYECDLPIITTYGSTETLSQVTATFLKDDLTQLLSSGRCLKGREIRIADNGEICVRGDMLCVPGFYRTGDLGFLDVQGYLHVQGRLDNRFISGGENIYPEEIERILLEHPLVESVVVVAKQDEEYGQRPVAFVKTSADFKILSGFLRERLVRFKIPQDWRSWPEELPDSLKVQRNFFTKLLSE